MLICGLVLGFERHIGSCVYYLVSPAVEVLAAYTSSVSSMASFEDVWLSGMDSWFPAWIYKELLQKVDTADIERISANACQTSAGVSPLCLEYGIQFQLVMQSWFFGHFIW